MSDTPLPPIGSRWRSNDTGGECVVDGIVKLPGLPVLIITHVPDGRYVQYYATTAERWDELRKPGPPAWELVP